MEVVKDGGQQVPDLLPPDVEVKKKHKGNEIEVRMYHNSSPRPFLKRMRTQISSLGSSSCTLNKFLGSEHQSGSKVAAEMTTTEKDIYTSTDPTEMLQDFIELQVHAFVHDKQMVLQIGWSSFKFEGGQYVACRDWCMMSNAAKRLKLDVKDLEQKLTKMTLAKEAKLSMMKE
ncbi:unnamed protein product [Sphenostylis stenocarpa]|uniref:Uncharacterized protein n=1 Tax=Sphenostylis stenocarpa TaxID=92480 RepID=A0AA86RZ59_9FABA|nr:unnamed protein product [Sphenostylis stenocarpa]